MMHQSIPLSMPILVGGIDILNFQTIILCLIYQINSCQPSLYARYKDTCRASYTSMVKMSLNESIPLWSALILILHLNKRWLFCKSPPVLRHLRNGSFMVGDGLSGKMICPKYEQGNGAISLPFYCKHGVIIGNLRPSCWFLDNLLAFLSPCYLMVTYIYGADRWYLSGGLPALFTVLEDLLHRSVDASMWKISSGKWAWRQIYLEMGHDTW